MSKVLLNQADIVTTYVVLVYICCTFLLNSMANRFLICLSSSVPGQNRHTTAYCPADCITHPTQSAPASHLSIISLPKATSSVILVNSSTSSHLLSLNTLPHPARSTNSVTCSHSFPHALFQAHADPTSHTPSPLYKIPPPPRTAST